MKEPEWWTKYKEDNPEDKDEYDPLRHCCKIFWKDFCECVKEHKKKEKLNNIEDTLKFLQDNNIKYKFTKVDSIVEIEHEKRPVLVSLKKKNGLIKCKFKGNKKWYDYSKYHFSISFLQNQIKKLVTKDDR